MPIGTGIIYNAGDLILGTVSGSGTAFLETKIAAATSSIVYFDSNARINSASLNSITVGTASYVSGSTSIITNLTASNISASGTGSFGMVGIGTTVPVAKLQVAGAGIFASELLHNSSDQIGWVNAKFTDYNDGHGIYISSLQAGGGKWLSGEGRYWNSGLWRSTSTTSTAISLDSGVLKFYTNSGLTANSGFSPSERMRIDSGGAVGIGTTTVSRILHAYVTTGPVMRVQSSGSNASIEFIPSIGHNRYNWLIGAQQNISDAFEITPSTATNGTTFTTPAILVASSGNIGIGTTSPTQRLDLSGSLRIQSTGTYSDPADNAGFINYDSTGGIFTLSARSNGGNTFMAFRTSDAGTAGERMRIINDGNVGIGTTVPAFKLDVLGDLRVSGTTSTVGSFVSSATSCFISLIDSSNDNVFLGNDDGDFLIQTPTTSYSTKLIVKDDGNVGIGTTTPATKFEMVGGEMAIKLGANTTSSFQWKNSSGTKIQEIRYDDSDGSMTLGGIGSYPIKFITSTTEKVRIAGDGNVLIGTTTSTANGGLLQIGQVPNTTASSIGFNNEDNAVISAKYNLVFQIDNTNSVASRAYEWNKGGKGYSDGTNLMTLNASGSLGIGTNSPTAKLEVVNTGRILGVLRLHITPQTTFYDNTFAVGTDGGGANGFIYTSGTGGTFPLDTYGELILQAGPRTGYNNGISLVTGTTSPSVKLRIAEGGNVGIGTSSPQFLLDVVSTSTTPKLRIGNAGSNNGAQLILAGSNTTKNWVIANQQNLNGTLEFTQTNATGSSTVDTTPSMVINSSGNVGIGTTSPGSLLTISGTGTLGSVFQEKITNGTTTLALGTNATASEVQSQGSVPLYLNYGGNNVCIVPVGSGFVGIGTSSPNDLLHLQASSSIAYDATSDNGQYGSGAGITITNMDETSQSFAQVNLQVSGNAGRALGRIVAIRTASATSDLAFVTENANTKAEKMRILSDGNLGIGTTAPGAKLEISSSTAASLLNVKGAGGNGLLFVSGSGEVGIGTTSLTDGARLTILGETRIASSAAYFTHLNYLNGGNNIISSANGGSTVFRGSSNNITAMTILGSGLVGIGTSSPAVKLDVVGTTETSIRVADTGGSSLELYQQVTDSYLLTTNALRIYTSGSARMSILNNGNVGIGRTSPQQKLHIAGTNARLAISNDSDNNWAEIGNDGSSGQNTLEFFTGTSVTPAMSITNDNNVGIGTSSPVAALDVSRLEYPSLGGVLANFSAGTTDPTTEKYVILRQTYTGTAFDSPMLVFRANANSANSGSFGIVRTTSNGSIVFSNVNATSGTVTSVSEKMRINSDGNVGIGTTSPAYKLHVAGPGFIGRQNSYGTYDAADADLIISNYNNSNTSLLLFNNAGAYHSSLINYYNNILSLGLNNSNSSNSILTSTAINITSNGVGIGTSSPIQILSVIGATEAGVNTSTTGGPAYYIRYDGANGNYINSIGAEYSSGNMILGYGATGKANSAGYVSTFANFSGHRSVLIVGNGTLEFLNSRASLSTTVGSDVPMTSSLYINNSGNVGIGTTSPAQKLEVAGFVMGGTTYRTSIGASGAGAYIYFGDTSNLYSIGRMGGYNSLFNISSFNGAISFQISDAEKVRIDSNGNVGIGTTSPAYKLEVASGTSGQQSLVNFRTADSTTANNAGIQIFATPSATAISRSVAVVWDADGANSAGGDYFFLNKVGNSGEVQLLQYSNASMRFGTNFISRATYDMTIANDGNVGIGTTTPTAKLTVNQDFGFSGDKNNYIYMPDIAQGTGSIYMQAGFGSAAAGGAIKLHGHNATTYTGGDVEVGMSGKGNFLINSYIGGTRLVTVKVDGNVGIGTTSPVSKLHISGSGQTIMRLDSDTTTNVSQFQIKAASDAVLIMGMLGGSAASTNFGVTAAGQAYIGTTTLGTTHPTSLVIGNVSTIPIVFSTNNTERMRILSDGNVGIGTTSPGFKLDVNGSAHFANIVYAAKGIFSDSAGVGAVLEAYNTVATNATTAIIRQTTAGGNGNQDIGLLVDIQGANDLDRIANFRYYDGSTYTSRMVIMRGGNVGIGTAAPAAKLEISGSSNSALLNIKSPISGAILFVSGSGAVGINTSTVGAYTLQVNGSFAATTKSFIIDHPTKAGKKLIYGSLESPYHGIRLTGRDTLKEGKCKVELPDYIYKLILHDSVNIQLTGIKCNKTLYVDEINIPENYFTIAYDNAIFESYKDYDFFWDFTGIRTDIPELITEL